MAISKLFDSFGRRWQYEWPLWRDVYEGGTDFINLYLEKYSNFEDNEDFARRKKITYNANFAASNLSEIQNAIFSRMPEINRNGGSPGYQEAMKYQVDGAGRSMNSFMGNEILPEMLVMQRVGIYIDRGELQNLSISENKTNRPYLYHYRCEDIRSVRFDERGELVVVLLRDHEEIHNDWGLVTGFEERFRLLTLTESGVNVKFIVEETVKETGQIQDRVIDEFNLNLKRIPFVLLDLGRSLMKEVARHQVALLNMSSSDIAYSLKSNFPFYVEQYDWRAMAAANRSSPDEVMDSESEKTPNRTAEKVKVGPTRGRRYPMGTDAPSFIHPSSEPLKISMQKQQEIKDEMRLLLHLAIRQLDPQIASAESKRYENLSLESGLAFIGLTLQDADRKVAQIWADYEGEEPATINYPSEYDLKTDDERREENKELKQNLTIVPSKEYGTMILKRIARNLLWAFASREELNKINKEIEERIILTGDPEYMRQLLDTTTLSPETQAAIAGLPSDEADKASLAHAERVKRINDAQTSPEDKGARGVDDLAVSADEGEAEKAQARNVNVRESTRDPVRGESNAGSNAG